MGMNSDIYGNHEPDIGRFQDFETFEQFFKKEILESKQSLLDIGGASGEFVELVNRNIGPVDGSVMDTDAECIKAGREKYPHIRFIQKQFPNVKSKKKYDIVSMNALFPHLVDWRKTLLEMAKLSKKHIFFSALLRKDGPTIADDTISYFYYMNTGKRVAQVINNIWEILNFISLQEMRAKRVWFFGKRHPPDDHIGSIKSELREHQENNIDMDDIRCPVLDSAHVFRGIPFYNIIGGVFFIELFSEKDNPQRMGGLGAEKAKQYEGYKFFKPAIHIVINNKFFFEHQDGRCHYNAKSYIKELEAL